MATINPFYRFEMPPANAGFFPECNRVSQLLTDFYNEFDSVLFQFQNVEWSFANKNLRAMVASYNASPIFANFEINYPIPFPALVGVDYFEITIVNKQLKAVHSDQYLTIGVEFDDTMVFCYIINPLPVLNFTASLDSPFIREEQKAIDGLGIVQANGFAFFEKPYFFNSVNQRAETSLARGRSWVNNSEYNIPTRPSSIEPMQLVNRPTFNSISNDARAVIAIMNQILKSAWEGKTFSELVDEFDALVDNNQFPDGWLTFLDSSLLEDKIEFTMEGNGNVIKYVGNQQGGGFKFQRFYGFGNYPGVTIIDTISFSVLPIEPNSGLTYLGFYWDFDIVEFTDNCDTDVEIYPMPIMPGDELSFVIPQGQANVYGLTDVNVGLFTDAGVYIQKIGNATLDIEQVACTKFILIVNGLSANLNLFNVGLAVYESPSLVPVYSFIPTATIPWEGSATEYLDLMVETFTDGQVTYVDLGGDDYQITWTINGEFALPLQGVVGWPTGFGDNWDLESQPSSDPINCSLSVCQRFLSANVTIPSRTDGCYRFGLYTIDAEAETYILYSLSNNLRLDWSDCFSTMIEFYGNENSVNQGFYYAPGWKHRIRLGLNGGGDRPKIDENIYRQSNGVFKRPSNKLDLTLDLHSDFLDVPTQKALVDATRHDFFIWNNQNIFVTGDVDVATIQDFSTQSSFETLAQVKFSALVQNYQPSNNACFSC